MNVFFIAIILFLGGSFLGAMGLSLFQRSHLRVGRRLFCMASTLVAMYGAFAFFGQALSACGGLPFLSSSVEWPAGYVSGIARTTHGQYIVPLESAGRIQIYDAQGRFLRGWSVEAGGGTFKLHVTDDDRIEVFTARKRLRYLFSSDGTLLDHGSYAPGSFSDLPAKPALARSFATPWILWPLSHPFIAWGLLMLGMLGMNAADRVSGRTRKR